MKHPSSPLLQPVARVFALLIVLGLFPGAAQAIHSLTVEHDGDDKVVWIFCREAPAGQKRFEAVVEILDEDADIDWTVSWQARGPMAPPPQPLTIEDQEEMTGPPPAGRITSTIEFDVPVDTAGGFELYVRAQNGNDPTDFQDKRVTVWVQMVTLDETVDTLCVGSTATFTAEIVPDGLAGTYDWELVAPGGGPPAGGGGGGGGGAGPAFKAEIVGPDDEKTVTVKGLNVSNSENDLKIRAKFTPNGADQETCESEWGKFTVVRVEKILYRVENNIGRYEWVDVPDPLSVLKGSDVTFLAVRNPEMETLIGWPDGKPEWGGTSGASGAGRVTTVTFDEAGEFTVTAECGNAVEIDVDVSAFVGQHVAEDDFDGRSATRYGVAEVVNLSFETEPAGMTATELGGLKWEIVSANGELLPNGNTGLGTYICDGVAESVKLKLVVQGGPDQGEERVVAFEVIQPDGGTATRKQFWDVWHINNTFSIGIATDFHLLPKDVSFTNVEFKEGPAIGQAEGWFSDKGFEGMPHPEWAMWHTVSDGDREKGSKVDLGDADFAVFYHPDPLPYSDGTFNWPIPWWYTTDDGDTHHELVIMNQTATVNSDGDATIEKGGAEGKNNHADETATSPSTSWPSEIPGS